MNRLTKVCWIACVFALAVPVTALADQQDEEGNDGVRSCIHVNRIRNTKVVDDLNILFYMRGGTIYHVRLPRRCAGLRREGRFSYRTTSGNLCHLDSITVLYGGATGLDPGASCRLNYFMEVTEEDAEGIIEGLPEDTGVRPLPPAEPEELGKETEES